MSEPNIYKHVTTDDATSTCIILNVETPDLLSECILAVLSQRFTGHAVSSRRPGELRQGGRPTVAALVLLYKPDLTRIDATLEQIRKDHDGAAIGIIIDGLGNQAEPLRGLAELRIIDGILPLNLRLDVFLAAVDLLLKGGEHFPSALLKQLSDPSFLSQSVASNPAAVASDNPLSCFEPQRTDHSTLTTREVQILDLLCAGTQNKIIAVRLHLSENTVKVHIRNIYKKLNVRNRTEAVSRFFNNDWASRSLRRQQN